MPSIESFGVEVGAGLRRMGVHLLCDLESVDLVEIERVNPQEYLGGQEIDMENSRRVPRLWAPRGAFVMPTPGTQGQGIEPALIDTVDVEQNIGGRRIVSE